MNIRYTTLAVAAALATMATFAPLAGALDGKPIIPDDLCTQQVGSEQNVVAAAAAEAHVNWQPDCVDVFSGGKVFFSMADLAHTPVAGDCFKFGLGNGAQTKFATFEWVPALNAVKVNAPVGNSATLRATKTCVIDSGAQQREGPMVGIVGSSGPMLPIVEDLGDQVAIHYICAIHGAKMHARVLVEKTTA